MYGNGKDFVRVPEVSAAAESPLESTRLVAIGIISLWYKTASFLSPRASTRSPFHMLPLSLFTLVLEFAQTGNAMRTVRHPPFGLQQSCIAQADQEGERDWQDWWPAGLLGRCRMLPGGLGMAWRTSSRSRAADGFGDGYSYGVYQTLGMRRRRNGTRENRV